MRTRDWTRPKMAGRSISPSSLPDWKPPPTLSKLSPPPPHPREQHPKIPYRKFGKRNGVWALLVRARWRRRASRGSRRSSSRLIRCWRTPSGSGHETDFPVGRIKTLRTVAHTTRSSQWKELVTSTNNYVKIRPSWTRYKVMRNLISLTDRAAPSCGPLS